MALKLKYFKILNSIKIIIFAKNTEKNAGDARREPSPGPGVRLRGHS
jgi:hypothetical protein